jgi:DNA polymerase-3 subunit delta
VLALVAAELKRDAALAKACAKGGDVLLYEAPRERDLPGWVSAQFQALKTPVDADAARALIEIVGDDLQELASEIGKIAQWAAGDPVTERDVRALASGVAETSGFELTDAWGRRDVPAVLTAAEEIMERSPKQRRDEVARLASMLASHVDRIRLCRSLDADGVSAKEAASRLKRHPFYVQKLYGQARNFSEEELRDATLRLAELDHALKGGSRLSPELELERALIDVTAPAQPARV